MLDREFSIMLYLFSLSTKANTQKTQIPSELTQAHWVDSTQLKSSVSAVCRVPRVTVLVYLLCASFHVYCTGLPAVTGEEQ